MFLHCTVYGILVPQPGIESKPLAVRAHSPKHRTARELPTTSLLLLLQLSCFSRVRLCNPRDSSPPGSSIHGIFQAKVLEWGAIAFSLQLMKSTPLAVHSSCSSLPLSLYLFLSIETTPSPNAPELFGQWHPTPVLLPGKSHGRRSLEG